MRNPCRACIDNRFTVFPKERAKSSRIRNSFAIDAMYFCPFVRFGHALRGGHFAVLHLRVAAVDFVVVHAGGLNSICSPADAQMVFLSFTRNG